MIVISYFYSYPFRDKTLDIYHNKDYWRKTIGLHTNWILYCTKKLLFLRAVKALDKTFVFYRVLDYMTIRKVLSIGSYKPISLIYNLYNPPKWNKTYYNSHSQLILAWKLITFNKHHPAQVPALSLLLNHNSVIYRYEVSPHTLQ